MQTITVEAEKRELVSNGQLKAQRKSGWIPAVVYGSDTKKAKAQVSAELIKIQEKPFLKSLGHHETSNLIVDLKINNQSTNAIIKEIQKDIISRGLLHVDFQKIVMTEKIEVSVPVHLQGEAPGVKLSGGILEHITRSLRISALPKDIPEAVNVDISALQLGQGIHLGDIKPIEGVQFITADPNLLIVNVVAPAAEEEVAATATPGLAEPEVIAKGKKPEEGAEGAAAAPAKGGAAPAAPAKGAAPAAGGKAPAK